MGFPLTVLATLGAASCVACAGSSGPLRSATGEAGAVRPGEVAAASGLHPATEPRTVTEWPKRSELFLVRTNDTELTLRAAGAGGMTPFEQVLARDVGNVLYIPELDLLWYNDAGRLFVMDTRKLGPSVPEPVLIARDAPIVSSLRVKREGVVFTAPGWRDDEDGLMLHWSEAPWIVAGEEKQRMDNLDGSGWLARERHRPARKVPRLREFDPNGPRFALPSERGPCGAPGICGTALPFGVSGWQLVVADEDYNGDFPAYGCLLHDPVAQAFATPPHARKWASAQDVASGACGPYLFNAEASFYIASDVVCRVGHACSSLGEGSAIGWVEPGPMVGGN